MEFMDFIIFLIGIWMLRCAIRSYKRKWVWKYENSQQTNIKFCRDKEPVNYWVQVILGGTVSCLLIILPILKLMP